MAPQTAQDKVLYVGNLPDSGTEEMVRDLFSGFGEVTAVVHPPPRDGKQREYCFVYFSDHAMVQKLIADGASGNRPYLNGVALKMKAARRWTETDQRFRGRGHSRGGYSGARGREGRSGPQGRSRGHKGRGHYGRDIYQSHDGYGSGYWGNGEGHGSTDVGQADAPWAYVDHHLPHAYAPSAYGPSAYGTQDVAEMPTMTLSGQKGHAPPGLQEGGASDYGQLQRPCLLSGCEPQRAPLRVAVLLSGGVDSSLSLRLLQAAGHQITAFYLQIWFQEDFENFWGECPWEDDLRVCQEVCQQAHVPLQVVSLTKQYWDLVVSTAVQQIRAGHTPNPDMLCNSRVKFGAFYDILDEQHPNEFDRAQLARTMFPLGCLTKAEGSARASCCLEDPGM
ncbi:hypothetical protein WJX73_006217 [Symbiochloris irregularis]|uniref:RRM domain-containing protein n=1 Tax=Symbiochloris irregularis TaxID=706552 RepID=A0AAW1PGL7_9CHLO